MAFVNTRIRTYFDYRVLCAFCLRQVFLAWQQLEKGNLHSEMISQHLYHK